jgi:hypothetical protein
MLVWVLILSQIHLALSYLSPMGDIIALTNDLKGWVSNTGAGKKVFMHSFICHFI